MANFFKKLKDRKAKSKTFPGSSSSSSSSRPAPLKPLKRRTPTNFSSTSFVACRFIQIFLSIAILGGTVRLAFFTTYSVFQKRVVVDNTILKNNRTWYYIMVGVSAFSILANVLTIALYVVRKLKPAALLFSELLLLLVWLAGIITWGIAINKFLGWSFDYPDGDTDNADNEYWYLHGAHMGILGLAILAFLTYIATLFIALKYRRSPTSQYSQPSEQYTVASTHHSFQQPSAGYMLPTGTPSYGPPAGAPPGYAGGGGEASSYYGAPPPTYVPGSGSAAGGYKQ